MSPLALDENLNLVVGQCPLLALSGHFMSLGECPLLGVKRTSLTHVPMSAFDPKRTLLASLTVGQRAPRRRVYAHASRLGELQLGRWRLRAFLVAM